jgi:aspartate/methionine/tyrosine aminotransferase
MPLDASTLIAKRALEIDASGIRKVFDLAAKLKDPVNLSIGQPDFDVPDILKERAIEAIRAGKNKYTPTQGIAELIAALKKKVSHEIGWQDPPMLILSGTSAGLMLGMFATLNPGDEVIFAAMETIAREDGLGGVDMRPYVEAYRRKRDRVVQGLGNVFEISEPGGAFYAFPKVPPKLGMTATEFVAKAIERNCLVIPGNVFSSRDTHFRLSYATTDAKLEEGIRILREVAGS